MASTSLKEVLRKKIREDLRSITQENIDQQSTLVMKKVVDMPDYQHAQSLSIFLSMPGKEISTIDIVLDALQQGKKVFIPYIHRAENNPKLKAMDMLRLKDQNDLRSLQPDAWGIPSLSSNDIDHRENAKGGTGIQRTDMSSNSISMLDVVFVPGVAFDVQNNRLGHGKGFYDRYLSDLDALRKENSESSAFPKLIGLALREQLLAEGESVPTTDSDWKIDKLVLAD